jgi:branched-chain amino acid transport system ATP-binding protein
MRRSARPIWARKSWHDARCSSLQAAYGQSRVLHEVSFSVGEGEVVTLLGRNGMGKTTTIKAIMGLVPPIGGEVTSRAGVWSGSPRSGSPRRASGWCRKVARYFPP